MQHDDVCDVRFKSPETQTRRGERARGRPPRMIYQGSDSPTFNTTRPLRNGSVLCSREK